MATQTDNAVHRLRDILVEEVSLVDRAANKRRFLVVKREGDMSELRSDGHGGFTRVRKGDDPEDTEKKKKPPFGGNKAPPFGGKPKEDPDDDEEKRKAKEPPGDDPDDPEPDDDPDDEEKRKAAAARAKDAPDGDGDEPPDDDADKAATQKARRAGFAAKLAGIVRDLQGVAQKAEEDDDEPSDMQMRKLLAAHRKLGAMTADYVKSRATKAVDVAKIGRKMSAARLAMYKEALATLQSLLSDLMDSPAKDKEHAPDAGDPQKAPPGWKAANPSDAPGAGKGAAAIKIAKAIDDLVGFVGKQSKEIVSLRKGILPSNAIVVDGERRSRAGRGDDVAWPMDLNAKPVDKSTSFLDE